MWGSEREALLGSLKGILKSYVSEHPKDKAWKMQLEKLYDAEAKIDDL